MNSYVNAADASRVFASRTFSARSVTAPNVSWPVRVLLALLFVVVIALAIVVIIPVTILFIAWLLIRGTLRALFGSSPRRPARSPRAAPATASTPIDAEFDVIDSRADQPDTGRQNVRVRQTH